MSIAAMNWAWQLRLKPTIKFVLMALADAADDDGYCWPSVTTLAIKTCMDARSVQRILKTLREDSLIQVKAQFRKDGSPTSNKYKLALKTSGDNLSPPSYALRQGVVTPAPLDGGTTVTQTTTEPSINQKPLQPLNIDLQETNGVIGCSDVDFIFPKQLTFKERELAKPQLDSVDSALAQSVLDELAARLNANKVTGAPLSYLRSLINRAKTGQFMPEAGARVASARDLAKLEKLKNHSEIINPSKPSEIPKHLAAMHQALSRKTTSNLSQKDVDRD
ncbi:MAG: helix-turn-helix domain-containing protein [Methylotenera sp.]